jgi:hypothetical protein
MIWIEEARFFFCRGGGGFSERSPPPRIFSRPNVRSGHRAARGRLGVNKERRRVFDMRCRVSVVVMVVVVVVWWRLLRRRCAPAPPKTPAATGKIQTKNHRVPPLPKPSSNLTLPPDAHSDPSGETVTLLT